MHNRYSRGTPHATESLLSSELLMLNATFSNPSDPAACRLSFSSLLVPTPVERILQPVPIAENPMNVAWTSLSPPRKAVNRSKLMNRVMREDWRCAKDAVVYDAYEMSKCEQIRVKNAAAICNDQTETRSLVWTLRLLLRSLSRRRCFLGWGMSAPVRCACSFSLDCP
jgi:hypothetical protein